MKPTDITQWGLNKQSEKIVRARLNDWLKHFIKQADKEMGNVYRCDFLKWDFFYFTKCHDLMNDTVESKAVEQSRDINFRKDQVFMQLFIRNLLNEVNLHKTFCSHCGAETRIDAITNGHLYFCPKCGKTDLSVYPETCMFSFSEVQKKLWEWKKEQK